MTYLIVAVQPVITKLLSLLEASDPCFFYEFGLQADICGVV